MIASVRFSVYLGVRRGHRKVVKLMLFHRFSRASPSIKIQVDRAKTRIVTASVRFSVYLGVGRRHRKVVYHFWHSSESGLRIYTNVISMTLPLHPDPDETPDPSPIPRHYGMWVPLPHTQTHAHASTPSARPVRPRFQILGVVGPAPDLSRRPTAPRPNR